MMKNEFQKALPDKDGLPSAETPKSPAAAVPFGRVEFKRPLSSLPA
ncbi:hypothetical protein [uncultured Desulfovibrio sp.]|nr:hypothetical protein [uncultured Desulfovibrio sp.]